MKNPEVEVCLSPVLYDFHHDPQAITVVVDIFRSTSAIPTALKKNVKKMIPVGPLEKAEQYAKDGFLVAGERNGVQLDFAHFGNSPLIFIDNPEVAGKTIVYCTTNGTQAIEKARNSYLVLLGSWLNMSSLCGELIRKGRKTILLCSGWKGKYNLEDTLFAGALAEKLENNGFSLSCDAAVSAKHLWNASRNDLFNVIKDTSAYKRLSSLGYHDEIEYCLQKDTLNVIPVLIDGFLVPLKN